MSVPVMKNPRREPEQVFLMESGVGSFGGWTNQAQVLDISPGPII